MRTRSLLLVVALLGAGACASESQESPGVSGAPSVRPDNAGETAPAPERGVDLERIATLDQPVGMAVRPDDEALYFAEKTGKVVAVRDGTVGARSVLDLSAEVSQGGEQGLLGLAFSEDGQHLYTNHTDPNGDTRITEWTMTGGRADPGSRRELLFVDQPFSNHNGGNLAMGRDGFLYIGLGDGGGAGDPLGNAQSLESLLGKMLRIDPRSAGDAAYRVPGDNPFARQEGARPEIWALGLRNPWRYSFDSATGDLWIADVGQGTREEVNRQPDGKGGQNYGWDRLEGTLPFEGDAPADAVPPVYEYGRDQGSTVIGGYVYRGSDIPELTGTYVFGDFFEPELRGLELDGGNVRERGLGVEVENLAAFGQDSAGELYALSLSGPVYRIVPAR
jgi:glucose/arabinose dehydrogenase